MSGDTTNADASRHKGVTEWFTSYIMLCSLRSLYDCFDMFQAYRHRVYDTQQIHFLAECSFNPCSCTAA